MMDFGILDLFMTYINIIYCSIMVQTKTKNIIENTKISYP